MFLGGYASVGPSFRLECLGRWPMVVRFPYMGYVFIWRVVFVCFEEKPEVLLVPYLVIAVPSFLAVWCIMAQVACYPYMGYEFFVVLHPSQVFSRCCDAVVYSVELSIYGICFPLESGSCLF